MQPLYQRDLAYVHAEAFETVARGAAIEIVRRLQSAPIRIQKVLDVGCGAGPLTRHLVDAGFEVTAIDPSAEMLELARANSPSSRFVCASAYEMPTQGYDAIIALGEPLTYHADSSDADGLLNDFLERVAGDLPPGGLLVFDLIGLGEPSLNGRTWRSGDDWAILVETTENQTERRLVRDIEIFRRVGKLYRRSLEVHQIRLFDVPMLCNRLAS